MFLTALVIRRQGAIVHRFERAGAIGSASARTAAELGLKPDMAWYQLVGSAVLRCPGEGRSPGSAQLVALAQAPTDHRAGHGRGDRPARRAVAVATREGRVINPPGAP